MQKKILFIVEKIKKYRKCAALGLEATNEQNREARIWYMIARLLKAYIFRWPLKFPDSSSMQLLLGVIIFPNWGINGPAVSSLRTKKSYQGKRVHKLHIHFATVPTMINRNIFLSREANFLSIHLYIVSRDYFLIWE